MLKALGLIEAIGLATAVEAADAAVKSANVELLGMEPCKGDGMHTIKVLGDVGAVKAACEAASVAGSRGRGIWSVKVIARPAEGIMPLIFNDATVGYTAPVEVIEAVEETTPIEEIAEVKEETEADETVEVDETTETEE